MLLPELRNDKKAQLALMAVIAESVSFDRKAAVKQFMSVSGMASVNEAYRLFKLSKQTANYMEEANIQRVRLLANLDKALTKAVNTYEITGKNVGDVINLGVVLKDILIASPDVVASDKANTIVQNNVNLDPKGLKALAEELVKDTVDVKPDEFKSRFT